MNPLERKLAVLEERVKSMSSIEEDGEEATTSV